MTKPCCINFLFHYSQKLSHDTIYGCGGHLGHVTRPSCINFLFHYSQKLSHDTWFQITQQTLRKTKFKFEHGVTFGRGQIMTLTFDIHVASLNHLVYASINFEIIGFNTFRKINNFHFSVQMPRRPNLTLSYNISWSTLGNNCINCNAHWFWRSFLNFFTIYGCGSHFDHVTKPICVNFHFCTSKIFHMVFSSK